MIFLLEIFFEIFFLEIWKRNMGYLIYNLFFKNLIVIFIFFFLIKKR